MKVGDYVRYKKTVYHNQGVDNIRISKIKHISDTDYNMKFIFFENGNGEYEENIIKSSPNIIDLIEVGDYVNGEKVKALKGDIESHKINNENDVIYTEYINDYDEWCGFEEDEIKSIITREQFSQMEYKVGE